MSPPSALKPKAGAPGLSKKPARRAPAKDLVLIKNKSPGLSKFSAEDKNILEGLKKRGIHNAKVMHELVEKGHITETELADIFGKKYGFKVIRNLGDYKITKEILDLIPQKICEKNLLFPLSKIDKTLVVVFSDPSNLNLIDNLHNLTGCKIQPVVAPKTNIKEALNKFFDNKEIIDNLVYDMSFDVAGFDDGPAIDLDKDTSKDPVISFVNLMFMDAIRLKSSDIHIESYESDCRIRYRIDGILHEKHNLPKDMSKVTVSRIKVMSGMDISEKRKPQDARLKIHLSGMDLNMRVNSTPTINGEKVVLRILDSASLQQNMSLLGMEEFQLEMFKKALFAPQGMILMTGPTGSGKTTTIYSGLIQLNTPQRNISTVEDPVEFRIRGINQVQMNPKAGLTFSSALRSFLRQDPDIILVGEIRDLETAEIAFKASATGHLVLSTLHTNDTASTVTRLLSMGIPSYNVADNISLIVSQRLLRKLCEQCRILSTLSQEETLRHIGVKEENIESYKGKVYDRNPNGCSYCNNLGYQGRVAIYEMMKMTKSLKAGVLKDLSPVELKNMACKNDNLVTLRQSALLKLKEGLTSVDEIFRTTVFD